MKPDPQEEKFRAVALAACLLAAALCLFGLDTRPAPAHAAGLSPSKAGRPAPVSAVFLCPVADTPNFGVAGGNRTPAQAGNTVAGCFTPERAPNPGKGFNSQNCKAMKKTTSPGVTLRVRLTSEEAAAFAALAKKDGQRPSQSLTVLARWAIHTGTLCPALPPERIMRECLERCAQTMEQTARIWKNHALAKRMADCSDLGELDSSDWWKFAADDDGEKGGAV